MSPEEIIAYVSERHGTRAEAFKRLEGDRVMVVLPFRMRLRDAVHDPHHIELGAESDQAQIDALFDLVEYCGCIDCRRLEFRPDMWWRR